MKSGLVSMYLLFASYNISLHKSPPFEIISSYSESWTAGIRNGGTGIDYYFTTHILTNEGIQFDSLWSGNHRMVVTVVKGAVYDPKATFSRNDTVILRATLIQKGKVEEINSPITYAGAALISYFIKSKRYYYTVSEMKQKKAKPRP
jgi:hypothetical protein